MVEAEWVERPPQVRNGDTRGIEMAEDEGWSSEEIQEAVDELINDIASGYYDEHIRVIARACFKRRDVTTGSHTVINLRDEDRNTVVDTVPDQSGTIPRSQQFPHQQQQASALMKDHPIKPVERHKHVDPNEIFALGGKRFWRRDIVGKNLCLPQNMTPAALRGCVVNITGVGPKSVKTVILTPPTSKRGKYYQMYIDKAPLFFQKNLLVQFCDLT